MTAAVVDDDRIVFKLADAKARGALEALGGHPWTYAGKMTMKEWILARDAFYDDQVLMASWAQRAHLLVPAKKARAPKKVKAPAKAKTQREDTRVGASKTGFSGGDSRGGQSPSALALPRASSHARNRSHTRLDTSISSSSVGEGRETKTSSGGFASCKGARAPARPGVDRDAGPSASIVSPSSSAPSSSRSRAQSRGRSANGRDKTY
ncbi:MAG: TfoX/Sxy family protein [Planctomycetes bacterium]|nr:TfoX/Sxy family protein [Planctomycetota bacterium]